MTLEAVTCDYMADLVSHEIERQQNRSKTTTESEFN